MPENTEITLPKAQLGISKKIDFHNETSLLAAANINMSFTKTNDIFSTNGLSIDPAFLEKAFKLNVTVATPTSMMALLRTIGYIFTRNKLADNADEIQKVANTFLKNITLLHGKIVAVGKAISSTAKAYEDLIPTAEKTVLSPARRIHNLGVLGDKEKLAIEYPESPGAVRELRSISADDDFIEVEEIEGGKDE